MPYSLPLTATADAYPALGAGSSVATAGATRFNIQVFNAGVYYTIGVGVGAPVYGPDIYLAPQMRSVTRRGDAIRFKSASAGVPAQVAVEAVTPADMQTF